MTNMRYLKLSECHHLIMFGVGEPWRPSQLTISLGCEIRIQFKRWFYWNLTEDFWSCGTNEKFYRWYVYLGINYAITEYGQGMVNIVCDDGLWFLEQQPICVPDLGEEDQFWDLKVKGDCFCQLFELNVTMQQSSQ